MKKYLVIIVLCFTMVGFSQQKNTKQLQREARADVRAGNEMYQKLEFNEAEVAYKKALTKNPEYAKAAYNLGNAIYQQNRSKEAAELFELVEKTAKEPLDKATTFHNMGNSYMKEKQYQKAVEAYKNSLRNNSADDETRYNLALAKELLKKEEQQKQDNKDNKDQNKENKDQKEKDGGDKEKNEDKNKDKKKGEDKKDDKGDEKKNKDDKQNENKQPRPNELSPEQMKQLLDAMNNEENKTQKKLNAQKAQGKKIKNEKDW